MACFKDSEIKIYDENISKYSSKAVEVIRQWLSTYSEVKKFSVPSRNYKVLPKQNKNVQIGI
jgi:deoxyadenosine/deoxycytidine kinase